MAGLAASTSQNVTQVLVWGGVLMLAVIVLFGGLWYYRKRVLGRDEPTSGEAWSFEDLQRMRQEGRITDAEYRALRATLAGAFRGDRGKQVSVPGPLIAERELRSEESDKNAPDFDLREGPPG